MQAPPEKLGSFYLGYEYDLVGNRITEKPINYDARDLTTHALCVGMTGSGKTGLCIGLLEEAAIDKVPAILIDPKGDITNLMLQFPDLRPEDFLPWVNTDDARRKGKSVEEYAEYISKLWSKGLKDYGIGSKRIRLLKESVDFSIYTPGSDAGKPISILSSLAVPNLDFDKHAEIIREQISGTVAALLSLAGIDVDPIRSREAILLSNIFETYWRKKENLNLEKLIMSIQKPPVKKMGVFDVDTYYPEKDRFQLAMNFNNLVASPSFRSWLEGEPLDIDRIFYTSEGKPRHSIFYIAHLSDREKMFFVTIILENLLAWVRRQTGTTSLRGLLYFDEIFGFVPPVSEPPSKRPLLTLLKQARAFGLGLLLVTQNPVDLDYKGLTNTGTWFIGKLQAERDKDRVLQGLKGAINEAGKSSEKVDYESIINKLKSRVFLMHNVHEDLPIVFHTRWVMSYLRGPLTRPQIRGLMETERLQTPKVRPAYAIDTTQMKSTIATPSQTPFALQSSTDLSKIPPALDPAVTQVFLPIEVEAGKAINQLSKKLGREIYAEAIHLIYEPAILGRAIINFVDRRNNIDEEIKETLLGHLNDDLSLLDWDKAEKLSYELEQLSNVPEKSETNIEAFFAAIPEKANSSKEINKIAKDFINWIFRNMELELRKHKALNIFQYPNENVRDFTIRLQQVARERRDDEIDKLKDKHSKQLDRLRNKLRILERELVSDEAEYEARKREEMLGIGGTVIGVLMGRRPTSAGTTISRRRRMSTKAKIDVEETKEDIIELKKDIDDLEKELKEETSEISARWENASEEIIVEKIRPRRTDIQLQLIALGWVPNWSINYREGTNSRNAIIPAYR
ncbi:helicase HerA domain-containing protein [[Eubacterium] cellulosolvens]